MVSPDAETDQRSLNVFEGPDAVRAFLDPDRHPFIPLVELPDHLNPYRSEGVRIFAKCAYLLPLLNIKSLPALNMLVAADRADGLDGVHTLVENSSGNMAFSLAILAPLFGIEHVAAFVPYDIAPGKLELLRLAGVRPQLKSGAAGEMSGIDEARSIGDTDGWFNPGQYENDANPEAHEKWIAPQIWEQTRGRLTVFAAGLGTTGSLIGSGRFFRQCSRDVALVAAICAPNQAVPGVRSAAKLREILLEWNELPNRVVEVGTKESFKLSMKLARSGILGGPSSGFTLAGLHRFLESEAPGSGLDRHRNEDGEVVAAFVCCDTPLPYLDKYSTHLDAEDFS